MSRIGEACRQAINATGLSPTLLSERTGYNYDHVRHMLNGETSGSSESWGMLLAAADLTFSVESRSHREVVTHR